MENIDPRIVQHPENDNGNRRRKVVDGAGVREKQSMRNDRRTHLMNRLSGRQRRGFDRLSLRSKLNKSKLQNALLKAKGVPRSRNSMSGDELKVVSELQTYLDHLWDSTEPASITNTRAREEVFDAMKKYKNSVHVAELVVTCIKMFVDKSKESGKVFYEVIKNFNDLVEIVKTHKSNLNVCKDFLHMVAKMMNRDKIFVHQLIKENWHEMFVILKDEHPSNTKVQDLYQTIVTSISMARHSSHQQIGNSNASRQVVQVRSQLYSTEDHSFEVWTNRDKLEVEKWAKGSLLDDLDVDSDDRFGEVVVESEVDVPGVQGIVARTQAHASINPLASSVEPSVVGDKRGEGEPANPKSYTPKNNTPSQIVTELTQQISEKDQTIRVYNDDLNKLQEQLREIRMEYDAEKEVNRAIVESMQNSELKLIEELSNLKNDKEMLKNRENELSEGVNNAKKELSAMREEMNEKDERFESMKQVVSNQMNDAKGHYIAIRQELEGTKVKLSKLQENMVVKENKIVALKLQLEEKIQEQTALQIQNREIQKNYEDTSTHAAKLETQYNTLRSEFANYHQKLAKQHSETRQAAEMRDMFKRQVTGLRMKNGELLQQINKLEQKRSNDDLTGQEVRRLKKENADLKATLFDMGSLTVRNQTLEKEKIELIKMTELLLANAG